MELRKALKELEVAIKAGFVNSDATFEIERLDGQNLVLKFNDIWDKGHPTDGNLDWGRQGVSKDYNLSNGKLIPKVKNND